MPEVDDTILLVDLKDVASPETSPLLLDERSRRGVLVFEVARLGRRNEEVVVRKEAEPGWLDVILELAVWARRG